MTTGTRRAAAVLAALLAGCGYKGPLTLPEKTGPVIIRPAPSASPAPSKTAPVQPAPAPGTGTATPQSPAPATVPEGTPAGG